MPSQTEKRLFRVRKKCPLALEDKLGRAMRETMVVKHVPKPLRTSELYEILAKECYPCEDSALNLDFAIAGSTGNLYAITLGNRVKCNCPDFSKRNDVCKHIMYTLVKVCGIDRSSKLVYQKGLLSTELAEIHSSLKRKLKKTESSAGAVISGTKVATKTKLKCRECQCSIHRNQVVVCPACSKAYHGACIGILPSMDRLSIKEKKRSIKTTLVTCPCCRTQFHHDEGYENIAHETGQSRLRDHTSYRPTPGYPGYKPRNKYLGTFYDSKY
jgi:SWIM zinc finger